MLVSWKYLEYLKVILKKVQKTNIIGKWSIPSLLIESWLKTSQQRRKLSKLPLYIRWPIVLPKNVRGVKRLASCITKKTKSSLWCKSFGNSQTKTFAELSVVFVLYSRDQTKKIFCSFKLSETIVNKMGIQQSNRVGNIRV